MMRACHTLLKLFSIVLVFMACEEETPPPDPSPPVEQGIRKGAGDFIYRGYQPLANKPLKVWYYAPEDEMADLEIVCVMHGAARNGRDYRDSWISLANQYKFLLLAPEFSEAAYPDGRSYNLGNIFDRNDQQNPEETWAFHIIDALIDEVQSQISSKQDSFFIYGHSAGAQFVHRYHLFHPNNKAKKSIAANAGWYTMPELDRAFPYGLEGTPTSLADVRSAFSKSLSILLGTADNDPNATNLRQTAEAKAQGPHRFARGNYFFQQSESEAMNLNTVFNWELKTVEGVGHSNAQMAPAAAALFFE
ncbi:MAG: alpha/beta hydrolase [Bacteroidota bacterium]